MIAPSTLELRTFREIEPVRSDLRVMIRVADEAAPWPTCELLS
jgi:hypothetical protein